MRCVIADPSASMRRILRNTLHRFGIEDIRDVSDGKQALEACDPATSLLITSWTEGIDGVELAKRIRENPETAEIPILMVTDRNSKDDIIEAREAGISEYMLKPFLGEQLRAKIERLIRTASSQDGDAVAGNEKRLADDAPAPGGREMDASAIEARAESTAEIIPNSEAPPPAEEERKAA